MNKRIIICQNLKDLADNLDIEGDFESADLITKEIHKIANNQTNIREAGWFKKLTRGLGNLMKNPAVQMWAGKQLGLLGKGQQKGQQQAGGWDWLKNVGANAKVKVCPKCQTENPPTNYQCEKCQSYLSNVPETLSKKQKTQGSWADLFNKAVQTQQQGQQQTGFLTGNKKCPRCNAANPAMQQYCQNCGEDLYYKPAQQTTPSQIYYFYAQKAQNPQTNMVALSQQINADKTLTPQQKQQLLQLMGRNF